MTEMPTVGGRTYREKEFPCWFSADACDSQGWVGPKEAARNSIQVYTMGGRGSSTWSSIFWELDCKETSQDST